MRATAGRPGEAALAYARRGWPVFPCHQPAAGGCSCGEADCPSPAKHPRTLRGLHDATTNPEVIRRWWKRWPEGNVAVRTGTRRGEGLVVLDIDPGHGGEEALTALVCEHEPLPVTLGVVTGSGGRHLYFAPPGSGARVRSSVGRLGTGLDVRADGGYVIAPPSRHARGGTYRWDACTRLAPFPEWLCDKLVAPRQAVPIAAPPVPRDDPRVSAWAKAALEGELDRVAAAPEGRRNDTLNRAAFRLGQIVGAGHLDAYRVVKLLEQAAAACGLGPREARATALSGLSAGQDHPRHPAARAEPPSHGAGACSVDLRDVVLPAGRAAAREERTRRPSPPGGPEPRASS